MLFWNITGSFCNQNRVFSNLKGPGTTWTPSYIWFYQLSLSASIHCWRAVLKRWAHHHENRYKRLSSVSDIAPVRPHCSIYGNKRCKWMNHASPERKVWSCSFRLCRLHEIRGQYLSNFRLVELSPTSILGLARWGCPKHRAGTICNWIDLVFTIMICPGWLTNFCSNFFSRFTNSSQYSFTSFQACIYYCQLQHFQL